MRCRDIIQACRMVRIGLNKYGLEVIMTVRVISGKRICFPKKVIKFDRPRLFAFVALRQADLKLSAASST